MVLNDTDIKYLVKKLAVPTQTLRKLTEEENDTNLIINEASIRHIKRGDALKINPLTYIKLIVFRYSYDAKFEMAEKDYVAKSIFNHYPSIKNCPDYFLIHKDMIGEKKSQYLLVLAGFFHDQFPIKILYPNYQKQIEDGFKLQNKLKELNRHVEDWMGILREIHKKNWLSSVKKIDKSPLMLKAD